MDNVQVLSHRVKFVTQRVLMFVLILSLYMTPRYRTDLFSALCKNKKLIQTQLHLV